MYTILIVDDNAFMRMTLRRIISSEDYTLEDAEDAEDALMKYKTMKPDLVIMDLNMPSKDGIEAVKDIIQFDPDANIIACSAVNKKEVIAKAVEAGIKGYILKPFEPKELVTVVKHALGNK